MINCKIVRIILMITFFTGCASTVPEPKFMPEQSQNVFPFFTRGQPIAAIQSANAFMLLSLEPTILADRRYFRLWILYQNISEEPYLLEPLRFVSLTITSISKGKSGTSTPESPTKILADISNEKALSMIMQVIGGALQTMAARPTTAETRFDDGSSATTTFNDQREKATDRAAKAMANTAMWYEIYQNSIGEGILRRNTVFPGRSVNGLIYFPFPAGRKWKYEDNARHPSNVNEFLRVDLDLPGESRNIYFTPIEGE